MQMDKPESARTCHRALRQPRGKIHRMAQIVLPILMIAFTTTGCKKSKKPTTPRVVIEEIEFKGNTRFKKKELLEYLEIGETRFGAKIGLGETYFYSRWRINDDRKRILELYQSAGYYQAQVLDIRVEPIKKDPKKVKIVIAIDEGEPVLLTAVAVNWIAPVPVWEGSPSVINFARPSRSPRISKYFFSDSGDSNPSRKKTSPGFSNAASVSAFFRVSAVTSIG